MTEISPLSWVNGVNTVKWIIPFRSRRLHQSQCQKKNAKKSSLYIHSYIIYSIYINHQCRVRFGWDKLTSKLPCFMILMLRSCVFCCGTTGFHQEASRYIPFPKLESYHWEKKQGHQIITSPVINYRQLHFRLFALEKDMKPNRYCISVSIHHLNTRSHLKYTDFEDLKFCLQDFVQVEQQKRRPCQCENIQRPPTKKQRKTVSLSIHPSIKHTFRHLRATKKIEHQITFQVYCYIILLYT